MTDDQAVTDGNAFPDGSHPVRNCDELKREVQLAKDDPVLRRYLIRQAIKHGCIQDIPSDWKVEVDGGRQAGPEGQQD